MSYTLWHQIGYTVPYFKDPLKFLPLCAPHPVFVLVKLVLFFSGCKCGIYSVFLVAASFLWHIINCRYVAVSFP
jgi:hypothetical protein